jgi:hypothetical protein
MEGLSYIPEYEDMDQEKDDDLFLRIASKLEKHNYYSFKNRMLLFNCLSILGLDMPSSKVNEKSRRILEIGIGHSNRAVNTSTFILAKAKWSDVFYIGIDRQKRDWMGVLRNSSMYVYEERSENVLERWNSTHNYSERKNLDLLHIDGSHSVNGVLTDWQFTQFVKDTGIIVLHDIKCHPGPRLLVDAIDRDIYTVHKMFTEYDVNDFGMAVVYKKENDYAKVILS